MDEDMDVSGWEPPPLQDDPDRASPPERPPYSGVSIGSDLAGVRHAGSRVLDLGGSCATTWSRCGYTNHPPARWKIPGE